MIYFSIVVFAVYLVFKLLYIIFPLSHKCRSEDNGQAGSRKSIAILVPAYNEQKVIVNCVKSLEAMDYPDYRVYIIDDGSTDNTFEVLKQRLRLMPTAANEDRRLKYKAVTAYFQSEIHPHICVIIKENGGKADALNAGISCCREEIVITMDADCMLREDALTVMNGAFQTERVVAAGGTVHITQSIDSAASSSGIVFKLKSLIKYQVLQYMMAFYMHKFTQSMFKALIVISGAFGAFRRDLLIDLNGYRHTVGEDMDITLRIHQFIKANKKRYTMAYLPRSVCYTECPESFKNLTKQRIRWQKAFVDCTVHYGFKMFWKFHANVSLFFIFDYLLLGTTMSFMFLLLPVYLLLYHYVSLIFIVFFAVDFVFGLLEGVVCAKLVARYDYTFSSRDLWHYCVFLPLQMISFRFLNILFVIAGTVSYIVSPKRWNKVERLGRCFAGEVIKAPLHLEVQK